MSVASLGIGMSGLIRTVFKDSLPVCSIFSNDNSMIRSRSTSVPVVSISRKQRGLSSLMVKLLGLERVCVSLETFMNYIFRNFQFIKNYFFTVFQINLFERMIFS